MSFSLPNDSPSWQPKAIVFDLLTALLDSWSLWDASTPAASAAEGRPWRTRYLELTFSAGAYVPYEELVKEAARCVGLPESAPTALLQNWETLQPWPEAGEVLQQLIRREYKIGVVTNCSRRLGHLAAQRAVDGVSDASKENFFDAVVTAEESGFYKPVQQAYKAILDRMGVEAKDVLFVAGSAGDVEGATNAGMQVVWHNRVGLPRKGKAIPLREARTLIETLGDFL